MTMPFRPRDTIAWRFWVTIVASMAAACLSIGLFLAFGGVWAQPPMDATARLEGAASIAHMIESAPPPMRHGLAEAALTNIYRVDWHEAATPVSAWLDKTSHTQDPALLGEEIQAFGDAIKRPIVVVNPDDQTDAPPDIPLRSGRYPDAYFFAIGLKDASWIVFTGFSGRYWGLSEWQRLGIWAAFLLVSFAVVSTIATRQISRPIKQFADAVRRSGTTPQSPPIARNGPQELQEVIAAFNEMQAQIREFVAYRTAMLAAISHDLRTPLTRIRLRGEFIDNDTQRTRLFRDVDDMQAMIDGALLFFRGDGDEEAARAFDLSGILQSIADDYADQGVEVSYAGPLHIVHKGRPIALKRAFTNLIENAVKYATPPRIEFVCRDDALIVTIRDHGPGIPPDVLDRVFRPFYRLDESRNRETGGIGLGLTAAQATIRGHGGDILLRNHPDGGLEATVTLPRMA